MKKIIYINMSLLLITFLVILLWKWKTENITPPDDHAEIDIMNTVCVEGVLNFSIINGYDCKCVPIKIKGEYVRCNDGD